MKTWERLFFGNREDLRSWLEENHDKSPGFCLICYKKHTKKECISYDEAVEEALCFGWIDSTVKRLDEDRFLRKFTPRTNTKNWSPSNKIRVIRLIKSQRMTEIGLKKIDVYVKTGKVDWNEEAIKASKQEPLRIPEFILSEYAKNEPALSHFTKLSDAQKRNFIEWITSAKREETIQRRIIESIILLKERKKLGMK